MDYAHPWLQITGLGEGSRRDLQGLLSCGQSRVRLGTHSILGAHGLSLVKALRLWCLHPLGPKQPAPLPSRKFCTLHPPTRTPERLTCLLHGYEPIWPRLWPLGRPAPLAGLLWGPRLTSGALLRCCKATIFLTEIPAELRLLPCIPTQCRFGTLQVYSDVGPRGSII